MTRDTGLSHERTQLAWRRMSISLTPLLVLALRELAFSPFAGAALVLGVAACAVVLTTRSPRTTARTLAAFAVLAAVVAGSAAPHAWALRH